MAGTAGGGGRSRQWISGYWRPGNPYLARASHSQSVVSKDRAGGGGGLSLCLLTIDILEHGGATSQRHQG